MSQSQPPKQSQPQSQQSQYAPLGIGDVRKLLDSKLVNTGVPGAMAGVAITRAFDGDWRKFLSWLGAAAGVWLLIKIGSRFAPKVDTAIDRVEKAVDLRIERTFGTEREFQEKYLDALKTRCYNLRVEGYKGRLPRLVLDKVYVPLQINSGTQHSLSIESSPRQIWDLLPKAHHSEAHFPERLLAVIADPGYGKTTLLRFLTLSFANQTHTEKGAKGLVPVLLLFRDFHSQIQSETAPALPKLIVGQVQQLPECSDLKVSEVWFEEQLERGNCLVMLDGLDEVPEAQRKVASEWANWQMRRYPSQFILTSRPHGYDSNFFDGVQRIDILDFNNDQKRAFIDQWYRFITWEFTWKPHWQESQYDPDPRKHLAREDTEAESNAEADEAANNLSRQLFADQSLVDLAKNPLLITIIAATHKANERLPSRRISLYRDIFKLLLEDRPYHRDVNLTIDNAEDNQKVLQRLAVELTKTGEAKFSPDRGADWIADRLAEVHPAGTLTPKKFLRQIQQISGLLAGGEGYLYEFTHKTFQEYLTAVELSEHQHSWGFAEVMKQFANEDWKEVVYFFATLTDPIPFIEAALKQPSNQHTLKLAQRLANENARIDERLKQQILNALQQQEPESAEIRLEKRFSKLTALTETTALSGFITWGEYRLFLQDQASREFHSWAETAIPESEESNDRVNEAITWEDARWFCAWLSTQGDLAPAEGAYHYRLPTAEECKAIPAEEFTGLQPWTADPTCKGNALCIVRERIPDRYGNLVSYLANGRWKEADRETNKLMLQAVGEEAVKRRYLKLDEIRNFPCDDLKLIDGLWVKFSGGKFGFSVQKQIWVEVGGKLDFEEDEEAASKAYAKMIDRNGWVEVTQYQDHTFDTTAPVGHLPVSVLRYRLDRDGIDGLYDFPLALWRWALTVYFLFSRIERLVNCSR